MNVWPMGNGRNSIASRIWKGRLGVWRRSFRWGKNAFSFGGRDKSAANRDGKWCWSSGW